MDVISALLGIPEEERERYRALGRHGLERDPETGLPPAEGIEGMIRARASCCCALLAERRAEAARTT